SLWDYAKEPNEKEFQGRTLMSYFTELPRGNVRLGAAGKIMGAKDAQAVVEAGCDYVLIGRAAVLRHDFPNPVHGDALFQPPPLPVTYPHLRAEGLSPIFIKYMGNWPGFVAENAAA